MTKIRFAIVGTNFISDRFAEAVEASGCAEIVAVFSRKLDTGRHFADKYAIKRVYSDYSTMLSDSDVDAVYIASPTVCHSEQTEAALMAGKHVLCEKMITTTEAELASLIDLARSRGLILLEAMRPDFDPAYDALRSAITKIGQIRRATLEFCQYSSRYDRFLAGEVLNAFDPKMKNSALADIGIYPLHLAVSLFGRPQSLSASAVFLDNGFEGAGSITLDYGDKLCQVIYSKITDSVNPSVIEGECGSITIDKINAPTRITLRLRGGAAVDLPISSLANNLVYEVAAFARMVSEQTSPDGYLSVSKDTMNLVERAYSQTGAIDKM